MMVVIYLIRSIASYVGELSYWSKNIKDNVYTDNQEHADIFRASPCNDIYSTYIWDFQASYIAIGALIVILVI